MMIKNVKVRLGYPSDARIIADFNSAMAKETENIELDYGVLLKGVNEVLNNEQHGYYIVAEIEAKVCACMMVTFEWSDWRNGQFWWIQSVYVNRDHRRQGIFKKLYHFLKEKSAMDSKCVGLRLYVEQDNDQALQTYESLGMHRTHYRLYEYSKK